MVARVIGASQVRLLDISRRGVLLETQTRLKFGAKATIHFTTCDASVSVRALVVRSLVAGLGEEAVVYHTALTFDEELCLADVLAHQQPSGVAAATPAPAATLDAPITPSEPVDSNDSSDSNDSNNDSEYSTLGADLPFARDGSVTDDNGEILLNDVLNLLVTVDENLESLQRRADAHGNS